MKTQVEMYRSKLKKLVLFGTTGAGKTTFVKNFVKEMGLEFDGAEAPRKVALEEEQLATFTPVDKEQFENSTTTISMNVVSIMFCMTRTNRLVYFPLENAADHIDANDVDSVYPISIFDPAGQERFDFMMEIASQGLDAALIFADGSNIASIERISAYLDLIIEQEEKIGKKIPKAIFVNKKDLESKGTFVGSASVRRWIDPEHQIFETTNHDMDSFMHPIRNLLNQIDDFPLPLDEILVDE